MLMKQFIQSKKVRLNTKLDNFENESENFASKIHLTSRKLLSLEEKETNLNLISKLKKNTRFKQNKAEADLNSKLDNFENESQNFA